MQTASIGHNQPPSEIELLKSRLEDDYSGEFFEFENLASYKFPEKVLDEEQAGKINDFVFSVKAFKGKIDGIHATEKKPYLEGGNTVDQWKRDYYTKIETLIGSATALMKVYLDEKAEKERQRQLEIAAKARIESERLLEEARALQDAGIEDSAQEVAQVAVNKVALAEKIEDGGFMAPQKSRSHFGATSGQKKVWIGTITSIETLDLEKLRPYFKVEDFEKALKAAIKNGLRSIQGANITETTDVKFR